MNLIYLIHLRRSKGIAFYLFRLNYVFCLNKVVYLKIGRHGSTGTVRREARKKHKEGSGIEENVREGIRSIAGRSFAGECPCPD